MHDFVSLLRLMPDGASHEIIAPEHGITFAKLVQRLIDGEIDYIDLTVVRDRIQSLIRVTPDLDSIFEDLRRKGVFHFEVAPAVFLDADGRATPNRVLVACFINTQIVPNDTSCGTLWTWPITTFAPTQQEAIQ